MICKSCGRTIENANANFCDYCGTSLREQGFQEFHTAEIHQKSEVKENEKPISFGNWFGSMILPFIPIVGSVLYLVMLLYWSFSGKVPASKKNWARASFIVLIMSIILVVFYLEWFMQQAGVNGVDINSYIQQLYGK